MAPQGPRRQKPPVVPCTGDDNLKARIQAFAEVLKTQSHVLGDHGLEERDFYQGGLFRGAIERIRGQYSATTRDKRELVRLVLNRMEDEGLIAGYEDSDGANRHDYVVRMPGGETCVLDLKECLDGNNTNIFERPASADSFVIWSLCSNPGADPRQNAWSGIHTRLSAEIVERQQQVDGLVVWDWLCGTVARPCPKIAADPPARQRLTEVGPYRLPPPCIYLFPSSVPSVQEDPRPTVHTLQTVSFLDALHRCFQGNVDEVHTVEIEVAHRGEETVRQTTIRRGGIVAHKSEPTAIRRR